MDNNFKKPNKFGSKVSKRSVLPVIFAGLLAGGSLAGSAAAIWQIASNYTESPEFTKSAKGRVKVDPFALWTDEEKAGAEKSDAINVLQDCAEKLSRWLKDQGQANYDVSYEVYQKDTHEFDCYLTVQFEVDKVYRKHPRSEEEEKTKIDNDPYLSFFDTKAFNDNEKTLVYRWYLPGIQKQDFEPQYTIIPFRDLFQIPKTMDADSHTKIVTNSDGDNGVMYNVDPSTKVEAGAGINEIAANLFKAQSDSQLEEEKKPEAIKNAWGQPRLYIINNIEGLYSEANYHISNWSAHRTSRAYRDIYDETNYALFAEEYKTKEWDGSERGQGTLNTAYRVLPGLKYNPSGVAPREENLDIFNYLDQLSAGTTDANAKFFDKYIDDIVTYDEVDAFFPKEITDDYKNDVEDKEHPKISYFWYKKATKPIATSYLEKQVKYGFNKAAFFNLDFSKFIEDNQGKAVNDEFKKQFSNTFVTPSFIETIFGNNTAVAALGLGFLIFLAILLIILALLYRTTGVMSWICMIFALSMSTLIVSVGSTAISISLLFGLFTIAIAGFMASLAICGRMKRRLLSREDTQLMIKKTFKKSLFPVVDITIITLIFGVCFTYIAPIALNTLGLVLITGSFAIFFSVYLLNALLHILFFNNRLMINKYQFIGKPSNVANEALAQSNSMVPNTLDATKLELPYYSSMSKRKIDATNKKTMIAVIVVAALLIIGIIIFSVLGFTSSSLFHTSTCLAIQTNEDIIAQGWLQGLDFVSYRFDSQSGWWYIYTNAGNVEQIAQQIASTHQLTIGSNIYIQTLFGSTNQDILNLSLISIIVATIICSIYGMLRFNWLSFVPMFAGSFGLPLLMLGIASVCQIKFDQYIVIAYVLIAVVNTIFVSGIVGSISETWSRKDGYNNEEFKFIVNTALKNNWTYIWLVGLCYLIFILMFAIVSPIGLQAIDGLLVIGAIVTLAVSPFVCSYLTFIFMKIRNIALNKIAIKNKNKIVMNYDDVDEQGIEGINKFTKRIPVSKEQQPQPKENQ